jgi:hypothetical protein
MIATLRRVLIAVPARLVRHGRQLLMRLPPGPLPPAGDPGRHPGPASPRRLAAAGQHHPPRQAHAGTRPWKRPPRPATAKGPGPANPARHPGHYHARTPGHLTSRSSTRLWITRGSEPAPSSPLRRHRRPRGQTWGEASVPTHWDLPTRPGRNLTAGLPVSGPPRYSNISLGSPTDTLHHTVTRYGTEGQLLHIPVTTSLEAASSAAFPEPALLCGRPADHPDPSRGRSPSGATCSLRSTKPNGHLTVRGSSRYPPRQQILM